MRILFIGSVQFSKITIEALLTKKLNIVGICGLKSSKFNSDHFDLSNIAKENNIPFKHCPNINDELSIEWVRKLKPEVIFCFGWSQILSKKILNIPTKGAIGFHPSKLPKNRGRHPIIWALVLGLKETGSTFFFMKEDVDSGDILSQRTIKISIQDNARSLYNKIATEALKQLEEIIPNLEKNEIHTIPQNLSTSNNWRKRSQKDGLIDWRMSAESINNLVRGLSRPYVGAHFYYKKEPITIWETKIIKNKFNNIEPGKVLFSSKKSTIIKAGTNAIEIIEMNPSTIFDKGTYL